MGTRNFRQMLENQWSQGKFVCVGLDSDLVQIPETAQIPNPKNPESFLGLDIEATLFTFNSTIVDATKDLVCAYKPNSAFYESEGDAGLRALQQTILYINDVAPQVPVILDAKRADIGNTNTGYVRMAFDFLKADAITIHPYLGAEALQPFLERKDKGIFVLCRTSNPGAGEFQDREVIMKPNELGVVRSTSTALGGFGHPSAWAAPLYRIVAHQVSRVWNKNGNCALVVGATYPDELREIRGLVGDMPILIPGIGAQGGDVEKTVTAGRDSRDQGMIINSSRGIIFASKGADFAEAARRETQKLHNLINQYRSA